MNDDNKWIKLFDYYEYLESSFLELVKTIPLENNGNVFSPKFYEILQGTCSQFEAVLKLLCEKFNVKPDKKSNSIVPYYKLINKYGLLYHANVKCYKYAWGGMISPFRNEDLNCVIRNIPNNSNDNKNSRQLEPVPEEYIKECKLPIWWSKYNDTKHDLPSGYIEGNLQNALVGLAGLYSLQMIYRFSHMEHENNTLDPKNWYYNYPLPCGLVDKTPSQLTLEVRSTSKLFIFLIC